LGEGGGGLGGSEPTQWPGPAGLEAKEDSNIDLIFEFQQISEFDKTLKICTRRFRGNLYMGIFFLKSSRLPNDF
jgi:hypothetical protein